MCRGRTDMTTTDSRLSRQMGSERSRSAAQPGHFPTVPCPWNKRALDVVLSGVGLLLSTPLWPLFAVAIKLQDGGPVFYAQDRIGEGGRIFRALKFRSMVPDAEAGVGAVQATTDDPRVTLVGRLLRGAAMDELPQLWNIFRGDMSFVGPRALRPGESDADRPGEVVPIEVHLNNRLIPGGFAWAVPFRRGGRSRVKLGLMGDRHPAASFGTFASALAARVGEERDSWPKPRLKMLPLGPVRRTYATRVLAVGDAAGLVKPTTGGGIYYGLLSGQWAAETLDSALRRNQLDARRLQAYETWWRNRLGPEIRAGPCVSHNRGASRRPRHLDPHGAGERRRPGADAQADRDLQLAPRRGARPPPQHRVPQGRTELVLGLAARGESAVACDGRCISADDVALRSPTAGIFPRRASHWTDAAPLNWGLGATPDFHHKRLESLNEV